MRIGSGSSGWLVGLTSGAAIWLSAIGYRTDGAGGRNADIPSPNMRTPCSRKSHRWPRSSISIPICC